MPPDGGPGGDPSLTLAVDLSALSGASTQRGIGRYLLSMLESLSARPDIEVVGCAPRLSELPRVPVTRLVEVRTKWRGRPTDAAATTAERLGAGVFWSPVHSLSKRPAIPWVQTILDLTPLVYPSKVNRRGAQTWLRQGPILARADAIVCPSRSSVRQGVELLRLPESRMHVVYLGIGSEFRPVDVAKAGRPYVLVVSAWGPHKGFDEAMDVVGRLADLGYPHQLRIVGPTDPWARQQLERARSDSRHPERVELVGFVDDLCTTYSRADVLICPSHAEGFGFPVAEAMACGTPVVTYDNTSLPEVVGDAGVLVPDGDVAAMTAEVRAILDDPARSESLRSAGLRHATRWSWPRAAEEMAAIFRAVAGAPQPR